MPNDVIALKVTGLKKDVNEAELRAAFQCYGFVHEVILLGDEEEGAAIVRYATRSALEAVGEAIAGFKAEPHPCARSSDGLTVKLAQDAFAPPQPSQQQQESSQPSPSQPPAPQPQAARMQMQRPPSCAPQMSNYGAYGMPPQPYGPQHAMGMGMGMGMGMPPYDPQMGYWGCQMPQYYAMPPAAGGESGGGPPRGGAQAQAPLNGDEVKLFVGGLPADCDDAGLRAVCQPFGNITDVHLMKPSGYSNQRCAFVTFEHHVSALAATKMSGQHRMNQFDRPIVVRFADTQGNKRQRV